MNINYYDCKIYKYGDEYKITYIKRFQADEFHLKKEFENELEKIGDKFTNNIIRAKSNILALALCNKWDFFVTFTLDKTKYDRYDLSAWKKDFSRYIRNQRRNYPNLKYLMIPEMHEDGAWHMHGLFSGYSWDNLEPFIQGKHPQKLVDGGYRFDKGINDKFGYNSFSRVRSKKAVSRYILKYISKDMASKNIILGNHLYYASNGLKRPDELYSGVSTCYLGDIGFKNEFMATSWISKEEAAKFGKLLY